MYTSSGELLHSGSASAGVWSICEYKKLIYIQSGHSEIEVHTFDLKKTVRSWQVTYNMCHIAVSNDAVYAINKDKASIVKFSLEGKNKGELTHPSFTTPYSMKPYKEDSIVVCDYKAKAVFFFCLDRCMWQLSVDRCSGVAVDWKAGNIWVKHFNKRTLTVITHKGIWTNNNNTYNTQK